MTENWWFQLLIRGLGIFGVAMTVVGFQCKKHSLALGDAPGCPGKLPTAALTVDATEVALTVPFIDN